MHVLEPFIVGHLYIRLYICTFIYMYAYLYVSLFICTFIYMYVYLYVPLLTCRIRLLIYMFIDFYVYEDLLI